MAESPTIKGRIGSVSLIFAWVFGDLHYLFLGRSLGYTAVEPHCFLMASSKSNLLDSW